MKNKPRLEPEAPPAHSTPNEIVKKVEDVLAQEKSKKRHRYPSDEVPNKKMQEAIEYFHKQNIKYIDDVELGRIYLPQPGMSKKEIEKLHDLLRRKIAYAEGKLEQPKRPSKNSQDNSENGGGATKLRRTPSGQE